nr:hypothetical protein [Serratia marcescens]
ANNQTEISTAAKSAFFRDLAQQPYSLPRNKVEVLFQEVVRNGMMELPVSQKPEEAQMTSHPDYCPYHQMLGHRVEDCVSFKCRMERQIRQGRINISEEIRINPPVPHEIPERFLKKKSTQFLSYGKARILNINVISFRSPNSAGTLSESDDEIYTRVLARNASALDTSENNEAPPTIREPTPKEEEMSEAEYDELLQPKEDSTPATVDELEEINLGTVEDPRPTFISASLTPEVKEEYLSFLLQHRDCFAWNYSEMPGLDRQVAMHRLAIDPDMKPIKQHPRKMTIELENKVKEEVDQLIQAGFIEPVKYPTWIANIVPVKKKNGKIRICIDYRDLNKACPKDDFPLPNTELMVDATAGFEVLSFMDGMSGYNQIMMHPDDKIHTGFRTPKGIFCYKVMPFGLKNAGATYQRAMTFIFEELIHHVVECYVDDLVTKSKSHTQHLEHLEIVFQKLRQYSLKMNPLKCAFGVSSGKFLGFVIRHRGIEVDPGKIKAIRDLPPPKNLKELRSLQGMLAYIRRFISNLSGRCHPFSHLMKKGVPFRWDQRCQDAFDGIKEYLLSPPVLAAPVKGRPMIVYTAATETSLGALLAQHNEESKEQALYYLSRTLIGAESRYSPIERFCLALVFVLKKLRHYLLSQSIHLVSRIDVLKYMLVRTAWAGRLAKWALVLLEFHITYIPQTAIKGQIIADFLAAHP